MVRSCRNFASLLFNLPVGVGLIDLTSLFMAPDSLHPPPEVLASWPTPNYIDPVTHGPGLTVVSILFTTIAALLVLARLWSRLFITRAPGLDDLLTCLSLACNIGLVAVVLYSESLSIVLADRTDTPSANKNWGLGRHMWDVPLTWAVTNRKVCNRDVETLSAMTYSHSSNPYILQQTRHTFPRNTFTDLFRHS